MYNSKECKGAYTIDNMGMNVKGSSTVLVAQIGYSKYLFDNHCWTNWTKLKPEEVES